MLLQNIPNRFITLSKCTAWKNNSKAGREKKFISF